VYQPREKVCKTLSQPIKKAGHGGTRQSFWLHGRYISEDGSWGWPGKNVRPYSKSNKIKRGWRQGWSSTALAKQAQGPELKTPVLQTNKQTNKKPKSNMTNKNQNELSNYSHI
jgi:hypothetical protein